MSTTNENNTDFWIPDTDTYIAIQELIPFVEFVATLEGASENQLQKAEEITRLIKNIDNLETPKGWSVCLDIFDEDIQYGYPEKQGIYWRKWWVFFELNILEITAETYHTADDRGHHGDGFFYWASIHFDKKINCDRIYIENSISDFVIDAMKFKEYMTESLNKIEIDINIW